MGILDTSLKLIGKFCPHPKFAKKEGIEKRNFVFFLLCPKRRSRLGVQETEDSKRLAEVRAPRLLGGLGEDSASLPEVKNDDMASELLPDSSF
jgi:hypothetical protein